MDEQKKKELTAFEVLSTVNVDKHVEIKDAGNSKLSYLSWAWAWAYTKKYFPDATYEIVKFNGLPYVFDEKTGYMVYTTVTIEGITYEMWLPVMDGQNRAMLDRPYKVTTKYGKEFTVQAATMFDINKTIMRCLTKNLAVFGLGLSLYTSEDISTIGEVEDQVVNAPEKPKAGKKQGGTAKKVEPAAPDKPELSAEDHEARMNLVTLCNLNGLDITKVCARFALDNQATASDFNNAYDILEAEITGMQEV